MAATVQSLVLKLIFQAETLVQLPVDLTPKQRYVVLPVCVKSRFLGLVLLIFVPALGFCFDEYHGEPISIDLREAQLDSVFRIIAEVSELNVVVHSDIRGKISLRLNNVPWDQVLDLVLRQNNLYQITEGNVMIIVPIARVPQVLGAGS